MPFGVFPEELNETYPVGHSETISDFGPEARDLTLEQVLAFIQSQPDAGFTFACDRKWESPVIDRIAKVAQITKLQ